MAANPITFVVTGTDNTAVSAARGVTSVRSAPQLGIKRSVSVAAARAGASKVRVTAIPGQDLVVLQIANGPELVLHPENARDLMLAQQGVKRSRGAAPTPVAGEAPNEVNVVANLRWSGLELAAGTRGMLGDVLLSALHIVAAPAAEVTAEAIVKEVDAQVDPGVYRLPRTNLPETLNGYAVGRLDEVPAAPDGAPILVLVHGTFSNTVGTFSKLWSAHPDLVAKVFDAYGDRVYALDHPTLGESPIANALALARALPANANVHLLTHSRGGLVAETFARVCGSPGISAADAQLFKGADYAKHLADLGALVAIVKEKQLRATRMVRVACPARGTILASNRLDAYLSVFKWALELGGVPVAPVIVEFLAQVAKERLDPKVIPGLAAQIPDNPFVQWLHAIDKPIPGDLRVIAGDLQGDSIASWLKTLMADSFYWTDNDLVVQTRSMYGGGPRAEGGAFVLDQGGNVSHFRYFENARTANAVVEGLTNDTPREFGVIGPLSWEGKSSTGVRARRDSGVPAADKPALFVLPGILGSNLKLAGNRIWVSWRIVGSLQRLDYQPNDGVEADGPVESTYENLIEYFSETHEVIPFGYDWRKPIEEVVNDLAKKIDEALDARAVSRKPVRIVAHSMGGLVARALLFHHAATWQRLMSVNGARLLMLGTPNAGSWAPMQVLSGDDNFGNMLTIVGAPFQDHKTRQMMAQFPGFIQLQADLLINPQLASQQSWQKLADDDLKAVQEHNWWHSEPSQLAEYRWGVPAQGVIEQARKLRIAYDDQIARNAFGPDVARMLLVVGHADFTPTGIETTNDGMVYIGAEGDGRVTLDRALLPGVRTWKFDCPHGDLPAKPEAFAAFADLLETGTTDKLATLSEARGAATPRAAVKIRPSRTPSSAPPPQTPSDVVGATPPSAVPAPATRAGSLHVEVVHGDLTFVHQPLMLGHYRSMQLTGAEAAMDRLLGGAMEQRLRTRRYPHSSRMAIAIPNLRLDPESPARIPRPESVIVAGLGAEGGLRAEDLVESVFQGGMAACEEEDRKGLDRPTFELAATLIGSGGMNFSPGQSAQLVAKGVQRANEMRVRQKQHPIIGKLVLIELYLDRASEALQALKAQADAMPAFFNVASTLGEGQGGMRRPLDSGYRGTTYDFVSATSQPGQTGYPEIVYGVDTKRARTEVTGRSTQARLIEQLILSASNQPTQGDIGKALFRMLVPLEMEPLISGSSELVMELDKSTAAVPWELLNPGGADEQQQWAIRCKLVRKLRLGKDEFRPAVDDALFEAGALIIGEPAAGENYPRLPGAREEAKAVKAILTGPNGFPPEKVMALISGDDGTPGPDAPTVATAFAAYDWRIVHVSGHGEPPRRLDDGTYDPGGIVLSGDSFLGPCEIRGTHIVPELVFINVCFGVAVTSGTYSNGKRGAHPYDRPRFAANVAQELIGIGVRCVIAAGWAVDDNAARVFAQTFYEAILRGDRFMDAVEQARIAARTQHEDTWAAYQCYGDPDWYLRRAEDGPKPRTTSPTAEFAGVSSPRGLELALSTIATRLEFQKTGALREGPKIAYLQQAFGAKWGGRGFVAEAFGKALAAAGRYNDAIDWYKKAVRAADGTSTLKAAEQLANFLARVAPDLETEAKSRAQVAEAISILGRLIAVEPTVERESITGSAYKRLAIIDKKHGKSPTESLTQMKLHYACAEKLAQTTNDSQLYYPAMNRIAAELLVDAEKDTWKGLAEEDLALIRESLARARVDFWSVASTIELRIYEALADKELAATLALIVAEFNDLKERVQSRKNWDSVLDQEKFVLEPYRDRVKEDKERDAASKLIAALEALARGEPK